MESSLANLRALSSDHIAALQWFIDHQGMENSWPAPLGPNVFLATKAKGIYKPAGSKYALSIRLSLDGPYKDIAPEKIDAQWSIKYAQEGLDSSNFTNFALQECLRDAIPVGVLIQKKIKPGSRYLVLGLGQVIGFEKGHFDIKRYS